MRAAKEPAGPLPRSGHYYAERPAVESRPGLVEYALPAGRGTRGDTLVFLTDNGVFSKRRVDFGSDLLIRSVPPLSGDVLDIGCGYGAIGIALAAMNPDARCWFVDINERAVALCRGNCARILGDGDARVFRSDGFEALGGAMFGTIVTNPPIRAGKSGIFRLYREARCHLTEGGYIYIVIQNKQGQSSTRAELVDIYGNCEDIARRAGYHVLRSRRVGADV